MKSPATLALLLVPLATSARAPAGMPTRAIGPAIAPAIAIDRPQDPADGSRPFVRLATERYDLRVQGTQEEAATFGKILESAWPTFREFFQAEPALEKGERLAFKVYDTREACLVGSMNDKADMPPSQHAAWFSPSNKTVYLYRNVSEWFTRYLVIYGGCLQFHGLAKPKNHDLDTWYTHGIAESFAVHSFDGEHLELATSPLVCGIDHPARALEELGGVHVGLDPFTDKRLEDQSVRWAVVRFAITGGDGRYRKRFQKLALGQTGSRVSGHDFLASLGREQSLAEEFKVWLLSKQMPLEAVEIDWEAYPDGRIVGRPGKDRLSMCAVKPPHRGIEAWIDWSSDPQSGAPAIVLSLQDQKNYVLARIVPPLVFVEHVRAGVQKGIETLPLEKRGKRMRISALWKGATVQLEIDDKVYAPLDLPEGRVGLAALGGPVTFRNVECR